MQRNLTENFFGPEDTQWVKAPGGAQPTMVRQEAQARPSGLCPPRVPPGPPLCSINTPIFQKP